MNKLDIDLVGVEIKRAMLTHEIMNIIKSDIELDLEKLETCKKHLGSGAEPRGQVSVLPDTRTVG